MRTILLFGAGKSASVLIDYLIAEAPSNNWNITIADSNLALILSKTGNSSFTKAVEIDIFQTEQRQSLIAGANIVISMMPPTLHYLIAADCLLFEKNLLTASYVDDAIKSQQKNIEAKGLLFLYEMGLDPGIDHMSAMKIIDEIKEKGGKINSFKSHCGGLVAPGSDDNPWHYKISWNPRNVVMAGKAGAIYKLDGQEVKEDYASLFAQVRNLPFDEEIGQLAYYPNRDSLSYISIYGLEQAQTFMRTTLRYPDFIFGWNNLIALKLTDETMQYDTTQLSLADFFQQHFEKIGFDKWLDDTISEKLLQVKNNTAAIQKIEEEEKNIVATEGNLAAAKATELAQEKAVAKQAIGRYMKEANLIVKQLSNLGKEDSNTLINRGVCSAADILQFALEKKWVLLPSDKDMIVMLHEFEYELAGKLYSIQSALKVIGDDSIRTAMAKTVGLPLGIAAKLILNGQIQLKGLHIPVVKEIYTPVLKELENCNIRFKETLTEA